MWIVNVATFNDSRNCLSTLDRSSIWLFLKIEMLWRANSSSAYSNSSMAGSAARIHCGNVYSNNKFIDIHRIFLISICRRVETNIWKILFLPSDESRPNSTYSDVRVLCVSIENWILHYRPLRNTDQFIHIVDAAEHFHISVWESIRFAPRNSFVWHSFAHLSIGDSTKLLKKEKDFDWIIIYPNLRCR